MSKNLLFPISLIRLGATSDSMSFLNIDIEREVEIPIYPHFQLYKHGASYCGDVWEDRTKW